jgi:hypothetical protein
MPAVGHWNPGGAATIAEPFASLRDCRPAGYLLADPDLHVVDQEREPAGIASLVKRGGDRQSVDRWHRQLPLRVEHPDGAFDSSLRGEWRSHKRPRERQSSAGISAGRLIGTTDEAIAKILARREVFRHDRTFMQMSVGDQPQDAILRSTELLGTVAQSARGTGDRRVPAAPLVRVSAQVQR